MNCRACCHWAVAGLGFAPAGAAQPGPVAPPASAYIRSLAVHPHRAGVLFAASPGGGLYRSRDAAGTWQRIDPIPTVSAYEVVVLPPGGSVPFWSTQWDRTLQGQINPPGAVLAAAGACELYVEVRDFQDGTRAGRTGYQADGVMRVKVSPIHTPGE